MSEKGTSGAGAREKGGSILHDLYYAKKEPIGSIRCGSCESSPASTCFAFLLNFFSNFVLTGVVLDKRRRQYSGKLYGIQSNIYPKIKTEKYSFKNYSEL